MSEVRSSASDSHLSENEAQAQIDTLRQELSEITKQVASYAEEATMAATEAVGDSVDGMKRTIRRHPVATMAVAVGAGAILAVLISQRPSLKAHYQRFQGYVPDLGLSELTASIERAIDRAQPRETLTSVGNRIANSAGDLNVGNTLEAAAERAMGWWDDARKRAGDR